MNGKPNGMIDYQLEGDCLTISGSGILEIPNPRPRAWRNFASSVRMIRVAEGITELGNAVFRGFRGLETVQLPQTLRKIGEEVFEESGLLEIHIPDGVTEIGRSCFKACSRLCRVTFGTGIEVLPYHLFAVCDKLRTVLLPANLREIGTYAFNGCDLLTDIQLPDTVRRIKEGAFSYCIGLRSMRLPKQCTMIGKYAFENCENLSQIQQMPPLIYVDREAFVGCPAPEAAVVHAYEGPRVREVIPSFWYPKKATDSMTEILRNLPLAEQLTHFKLLLLPENAPEAPEMLAILEDEVLEYLVEDGILVGVVLRKESQPTKVELLYGEDWIAYEKVVSGKEWSDGWWPTWRTICQAKLLFC